MNFAHPKETPTEQVPKRILVIPFFERWLYLLLGSSTNFIDLSYQRPFTFLFMLESLMIVKADCSAFVALERIENYAQHVRPASHSFFLGSTSESNRLLKLIPPHPLQAVMLNSDSSMCLPQFSQTIYEFRSSSSPHSWHHA